MKSPFYYILIASTFLVLSCNGHGDGSKKNTDSSYSGLEGTQEENSRLSGSGSSGIDTSSGQTAKKSPIKDSSRHTKDSVSVK